jgi:hypothetical protein
VQSLTVIPSEWGLELFLVNISLANKPNESGNLRNFESETPLLARKLPAKPR